MADGKLLFLRPQDGTGRLVFGDVGDVVVVPPVHIGADADLPGLGSCTLAVGPALRVDADLPGLGTCTLLWDANTSRPTVGQAAGRYQQAQPLPTGVHDACQQARPVAAGAAPRYQQAQPVQAPSGAGWQDARTTRATTGLQYQQAQPLQAPGLRSAWQTALGHRVGHALRYQEAWALQVLGSLRFQRALSVRPGGVHRYQEALRSGRAYRNAFQRALPYRQQQRVRYQEAWPPRPGVSVLIPVEPPGPPPCYTPNGHLVFAEGWDGSGRLVFVCQRTTPPGPQPGETVVVPVRRVYMTINTITLHRASDGAPITADSLSLGLDADSWTWSWQARLHASALPLIQPAPGGDPVGVLASINGSTLHLVAESYSRERSFASTRISVRGRGRAAVLDAPYAPILNHGNASARTAQQLMQDVLTLNGVGIGWGVAWGITDWLVPGGVWTHQGSYISALLDIADAAGAYLQPHDTAPTLRVLPRYPAAPWQWHTLTPDFELPSSVVSVEGIAWQRKAEYNRVHVSGVAGGVQAEVNRGGTAGDAVAPMLTHPLITHADAARQRGIAVLSDTGLQAHISLRLPVLESTGLIKPGALVRYVDGATQHLGLVRATSVEWQAPALRQTLTVETHPA